MDSRHLYPLNQAIKDALKNPYPDPWLPDLTARLIGWGDQVLRSCAGITAADYGTERVLAGSADAPRHAGARLPALGGADRPTRKMTIEFLTKACIGPYRAMGLCFYTPDEVANSAILQCLQDAIDVLAKIPSLQATVTALMRTCHVLKPENDTYDVSHSDPQVPFSIFVSIPQRRGPTDALRVAESLVHEAMHLQLTLIERLLPLVEESGLTYFSPWKGAQRSPRGVLHGLYVFRVVDSFFERLMTFYDWPVVCLDHLFRRRREVARQISEVRAFKDHPALTGAGSCLSGLLLGGL
jgi:HEXXH motif-containing protein